MISPNTKGSSGAVTLNSVTRDLRHSSCRSAGVRPKHLPRRTPGRVGIDCPLQDYCLSPHRSGGFSVQGRHPSSPAGRTRETPLPAGKSRGQQSGRARLQVSNICQHLLGFGFTCEKRKRLDSSKISLLLPRRQKAWFPPASLRVCLANAALAGTSTVCACS